MGAFDGFVAQRQIELADATSGNTAAVDGSGNLSVLIDDTTPVNVQGTVSVSEPVSVDDNGGSLTVDGPLTDAELRATAVNIADGGSTISIDDGGGSITVDGTVSVGALTLTPEGYEQVTVSTTAVGLTVPVGATIALIQAEQKDVRWRDDGTSPTAAVGMILPSGGQFEYSGDLAAIEFIRKSASDGILNVSYYS